MATQKTSGSQTAVISTLHTLATITDASTYVFGIDLNNMANGDILEVLLSVKLLTGSTSRVAYKATFAHVQGKPVQYSVPILVPFELICQIRQVGGTGRSFDWAVYEP